MFIEKKYKGTKTGYSATNTSFKNYNISYSTNGFLVDLFCNTLLGFLKECKVECSYDSSTKVFKINKIPVLFLCTVSGARVEVGWYFAFNTSLVNGKHSSSTYGTRNIPSFIYDTTTGSYEITFRLLGEPTTFFILFVKSYRSNTKTSTSSSVTSANLDNVAPSLNIQFGKAENLLYKKEVMLVYSLNSMGSFYTIFYAYEFDENDEPIESERNKANPVSFLVQNTPIAKEISNYSGKLPLYPCVVNGSGFPSYIVTKGLYTYVNNINLPVNSSATSADTQTFFTADGETFYVTCGNQGIIKVVN